MERLGEGSGGEIAKVANRERGSEKEGRDGRAQWEEDGKMELEKKAIRKKAKKRAVGMMVT